MSSKARIGVLMGGLSAEREVSLKSGAAVLAALIERGYPALAIEVDRNFDRLLRSVKVDLIFNALHGRYGEDGCIQGCLELRQVPYTGSGVLASALSMNKIKAKELFRVHNLPTPPYYVATAAQARPDEIETTHGAFGFPVIAKPVSQGSSLGVSVAHDLPQLRQACADALRFADAVLIERLITGKEVHVGIVNGEALGAIEIVSHNEIFDYEAKYTPGHADFYMPARLAGSRYSFVLGQALRAHHALDCRGATRVNMMVSQLGNEYILEVNTAPGLTHQSVLPRIADHAGLSYADLIERIVSGAVTEAAAAP